MKRAAREAMRVVSKCEHLWKLERTRLLNTAGVYWRDDSYRCIRCDFGCRFESSLTLAAHLPPREPDDRTQ